MLTERKLKVEKKSILKKNVGNTKQIFIICISIILIFLYFNYKVEINDFELYQKLIAYIIMFVLILIMICLYIYINNSKLKIEKIFLVVAVSFCTLLCITMPITKGHDETIHGFRIYEYVNGKIVSDGKNVNLQRGVVDALKDKPSYTSLFKQSKDNYNTNTEIVNIESRIASYSPITYLPQIIGIYIGKIFTSNALIQLYFARILNMIVCITMLYYAVKLIPFGKNVIFLISLIPIAIEGYVTLSADGITIATAILFISFVLYLAYGIKEKVSSKQMIILLLISIVLAISKTVYLPMILFIFIIPKEKFKNNKYFWLCSIFLLASLADFIWFLTGTKTNVGGQNQSAIAYIILNPIQYIGKVLYTIASRGCIYLEEIFGGYLEWNENVKIYVFPIILLITTILLITKGEEESFKFKNWQKVLCLFIVISTIILIFTSMFLGWARLELNYIEGIQGRYFLPLLPLILLLLSRKFLDDENTTQNLALLILIMQIFVIINVVIFHI